MTFKGMAAAAIGAVLAAGCVMKDQAGMVGSAIDDRHSPSEQRLALQTVRVAPTIPSGAQSMGRISARRCHRNFTEQAPSEGVITNQLRITAYSQGADGIADLRFEKINGLLANCWYVLEGSATAFAAGK